jgi:signal peptidase I
MPSRERIMSSTLPGPDLSHPLEPEGNPSPASEARRRVGWIREILETLVPAVLLALLINMFVAQATRVDGPSMLPGLHTNQRLVVEKVSYRLHPPHRGDVVVLRLPHNPAELLIKRVIALAGDTIEIRDGTVLVDGQVLTESYVAESTNGVMASRLVPEDSVFVMGDNRGQSNDSRSFGPVSVSSVVGRAFVSYWPLSTIGFVH